MNLCFSIQSVIYSLQNIINVNSLLVIQQNDNTSPRAVAWGEISPYSHKRCRISLRNSFINPYIFLYPIAFNLSHSVCLGHTTQQHLFFGTGFLRADLDSFKEGVCQINDLYQLIVTLFLSIYLSLVTESITF